MAQRVPGPFGVLLKRYRVAALLTQEQLAVRAQLSADTIRALERGKRRAPRADSVRLLAEALSLSGEEREALMAAARALKSNPPVAPTVAHALVAQPNLLLGREAELATIRERLTSAEASAAERARLLTLTGPAGVGKTRLALAAAAQLADQFRDGVLLVDLAPIREPQLALSTIAHALDLADTGGRPLLDRLSDALRERAVLLVLDNFEQVLPAARALADLLAACPQLALLVTSRVPLRLRWEWTLRVAPLPTPDLDGELPPLEALTQLPSVALFIARARARQANFALTPAQVPLIARLVAGLDGLPLALELAAARLDALTLPMLAQRLDDRLGLLRWEARDMPERQQSLEAAVGWSYELLSASERLLFRCLGVFTGGATPDALTAIVGAVADGAAPDARRTLEGLASLAEKSLALPGRSQRRDGADDDENDAEQEPAFTMLETVREYAWEQFERQGELDTARHAHARFFLELAEQTDPRLRGRDQRAWYVRLEREHNNLRAALRWLLSREGPDARGEHEAGLRLAVALGWFWWTRGYIVEGARWLNEALDRAPEADLALRAHALWEAGAMLTYQGEVAQARTVLEKALTLAQQSQNPIEIAQAYSYLGMRAVYAGDVAASIPLLREGLRRGRQLGEPHRIGMTLLFLGTAMFAQGDNERATAIFTESLARFEATGDRLFAVNLQLNLGWLAWQRGDLADAVGRLRAGLEAGVTSDNRRLLSFATQVALSLLESAHEANDSGDSGDNLSERARLLGAIDMLNQATGMTLMQTTVKASMADLRQQVERAGLEVAYREGRSLPFRAIAALALTLLDELDQTLSHATGAPSTAARRGPPPPQQRHRHLAAGDYALSEREREILRLVAQGLSNKAIGRQLFLSASTVNYHLTSAFNKLGVNARAQAVAVATQRDLL